MYRLPSRLCHLFRARLHSMFFLSSGASCASGRKVPANLWQIAVLRPNDIQLSSVRSELLELLRVWCHQLSGVLEPHADFEGWLMYRCKLRWVLQHCSRAGYLPLSSSCHSSRLDASTLAHRSRRPPETRMVADSTNDPWLRIHSSLNPRPLAQTRTQASREAYGNVRLC